MKNLFLIQTPDETRVAIKSDGLLFLTNHPYPNSPKFANHHIYITNGEHPKKGDYMLYGALSIVKCEADIDTTTEHFKMYGMGAREKIIMTTDPKLIADGVQPIPDDFLEWFVDNQSCEEIEVKKFAINCSCEHQSKLRPNSNLIREYTTCHERNHCDTSYKIFYPIPLFGRNEPVKTKEELEKRFYEAFNIPQQYHGQEDKPNVIVVGSGLPPAKLTLELTQQEARGLLNCLIRTHAKGTDLDVSEKIEEKLLEFLKPLEK